MKTLFKDERMHIALSRAKALEEWIVFDIRVIIMTPEPLRCDTVQKTVTYSVRRADGKFKTFSKEPPYIFHEVHKILCHQGMMTQIGRKERFSEKFLESLNLK